MQVPCYFNSTSKSCPLVLVIHQKQFWLYFYFFFWFLVRFADQSKQQWTTELITRSNSSGLSDGDTTLYLRLWNKGQMHSNLDTVLNMPYTVWEFWCSRLHFLEYVRVKSFTVRKKGCTKSEYIHMSDLKNETQIIKKNFGRCTISNLFTATKTVQALTQTDYMGTYILFQR